MSVGLGFLNQLLIDQPTFSFLDEFGLRMDDFSETEVVLVKAIIDYLMTYGEFPSKTVIEAENDFTFPEFPEGSLQYWVDGIIRRTSNKILLTASKTIETNIINGKDGAAFTALHDAYSTVSLRKRGRIVVPLSELAESVLNEHDEQQHSDEMLGVPFGFPYIDAVSGGAQPGDLVAIVAKTSVGKTYTLLKMANSAYAQGRTPMVVSTEMSPIQYARRIIALMSHIPVNRVRLGELSTHLGRRRLQSQIQELANSDKPYYIMRSTLSTSMDDVVLQIREKKPDCVYVDGAYLLKGKGAKSRFEQVSSGVETLKLLAQEVNKPIIATYQIGNKKGSVSLENVYQSDVIVQVASIVFGMRNDTENDDEDETGRVISGRSYKILDILKGREGEKGRIRILFDMMQMLVEEVEVLRGMGDVRTE